MKLLALLLVTLVAFTLASCSEQGPNESGKVRSKLYHAVEDKVLQEPQGQELHEQWALSVLALGSVNYVGESDTYEVRFLADPYDSNTEEIWGVNMNAGEVRPLDVGALFSASLFFCEYRYDTNPECQNHLEAIELLIRATGSK